MWSVEKFCLLNFSILFFFFNIFTEPHFDLCCTFALIQRPFRSNWQRFIFFRFVSFRAFFIKLRRRQRNVNLALHHHQTLTNFKWTLKWISCTGTGEREMKKEIFFLKWKYANNILYFFITSEGQTNGVANKVTTHANQQYLCQQYFSGFVFRRAYLVVHMSFQAVATKERWNPPVCA